MPIPILELTRDELRKAAADLGEKAYRADQLAGWVYSKSVTDPAKMTNLPKLFTEQFTILDSRVIETTVSSDETVKLLIELTDGEHVETVLIPANRRNTICLSTQVGCAMGCKFCASTIGGLKRNMTASEILQQILHVQQACDVKVTNAVFMGVGEPLVNYDAVVAAVRAIIDPDRFGISARKVTVSTLGIPDQIRRLARENLPITLAISLHAPNDALRRELIPSAATTKLDAIIAAAEDFYESRKREVTLEYLLLDEVNDSALCADALARIAKRLRCNVNLISYNPVESLPFARPSQVKVKAFTARLEKQGVNVNVRQSRGLDAAAACGQLRHSRQAKD